jgi:ubiquinone/menaquinone biosynthesis C-methylase UbiE
VNDSTAKPALEFSGERFTPECLREIWYEHFHRYVFARRFAPGKRVLDAACGEGYGSALLAEVATSVLGVDIAGDAVAHARTRYAEHSNLAFESGDATALGLPESSIDLVVSFETLEHVQAQDELVAGFARVLVDDGLLLISSPDKRTYSDVSGFRNEFHVRELYREELLALLRKHFPFVHLFAQKLLFQSILWSLDAANGAPMVATADAGGRGLKSTLDYAPLYFLAICSKQALPASLPPLSTFGDREESVYQHYNHEIRKNMAAGGIIAGLEHELGELRAQLAVLRELPQIVNPIASSQPAASAPPPNWWQRLLRRL